MPKNINSAYRVHKILTLACDQTGPDIAMLQVLGKAFSIPYASGRRLIFEVTRMMDLFYSEIERTKNQMQSSDFSLRIMTKKSSPCLAKRGVV